MVFDGAALVGETAERLRAILTAIDAGELFARPVEVARIEGALIVLEQLVRESHE